MTFVILAHGNPRACNELARRLHPYPVVIHVDARSSLDGYISANHVTYIRQRIAVHWGGFSMVQATKLLYRAALDRAESPGTHITLLSAACAPLRPVADIVSIIGERPDENHCKAGLLLDGDPQHERRVREPWFFDSFDARAPGLHGRINAVQRRLRRQVATARSDFLGLRIATGSQWTSLTVDTVAQIMDDPEVLTAADDVFRNALAPDEMYFHTVLASRDVSWEIEPVGTRTVSDFANLHWIDPSLTRILSSEELQAARAAGKLFARKVDEWADPDVRATLREFEGH